MSISTAAARTEEPAGAPARDAQLLDAYSQTVTRVARTVGPATAKVDVRRTPGGPMASAEGRGEGGSGSGFLFTPDGLIVTNSHVIHGARRIEVTLPGREAQTARVVGEDPHTDLAVLSIAGHDLPFAHFGSSAARATPGASSTAAISTGTSAARMSPATLHPASRPFQARVR